MSTATDPDASKKTPIRILALDGGGVRGLSSLLILRQLMQRMEIQRREAIHPCECFDLIIGTGTGGISALFLGRLRMSVDDAIREYAGMAHTAFKPTPNKWPSIWKHNSDSLLSGVDLAHTISDIATRFLGKADATLAETSQASPQCRTAVLATPTANADAPPYVIRSYPTKLPASLLTIPEAARATASTAGLFAPVALGKPPVRYGDAGLSGYNNPAEIALQEAALIWPGVKIDCVVSIGTGLQKIVSVGKEWADIIKASKRIIESCELIHDRVFRGFYTNNVPYFRFNVDRGLDGVAITEWKEAGSEGTLTGITESYMRWGAIDVSLDSCVSALIEVPVDRSLTQGLSNEWPAAVSVRPTENLPSDVQSRSRAVLLGHDPPAAPKTVTVGNQTTRSTLLETQKIQITLTLTPKDLPDNDVSTKVAWEVFNIGDGKTSFECEMPSDLGFGSVKKDEDNRVETPFFTFCSHGSTVRVRSRYGHDFWENSGGESDVEGTIGVTNATGHPKSVVLGSYHRGTTPRLQPFHLIPEIGKNAKYSVSSNLLLQAYRTQGCEKGKEIERNQLADILFEAPVKTLQQITMWHVRPKGSDGIKLEVGTKE